MPQKNIAIWLQKEKPRRHVAIWLQKENREGSPCTTKHTFIIAWTNARTQTLIWTAASGSRMCECVCFESFGSQVASAVNECAAMHVVSPFRSGSVLMSARLLRSCLRTVKTTNVMMLIRSFAYGLRCSVMLILLSLNYVMS